MTNSLNVFRSEFSFECLTKTCLDTQLLGRMFEGDQHQRQSFSNFLTSIELWLDQCLLCSYFWYFVNIYSDELWILLYFYISISDVHLLALKKIFIKIQTSIRISIKYLKTKKSWLKQMQILIWIEKFLHRKTWTLSKEAMKIAKYLFEKYKYLKALRGQRTFKHKYSEQIAVLY